MRKESPRNSLLSRLKVSPALARENGGMRDLTERRLFPLLSSDIMALKSPPPHFSILDTSVSGGNEKQLLGRKVLKTSGRSPWRTAKSDSTASQPTLWRTKGSIWHSLHSHAGTGCTLVSSGMRTTESRDFLKLLSSMGDSML